MSLPSNAFPSLVQPTVPSFFLILTHHSDLPGFTNVAVQLRRQPDPSAARILLPSNSSTQYPLNQALKKPSPSGMYPRIVSPGFKPKSGIGAVTRISEGAYVMYTPLKAVTCSP